MTGRVKLEPATPAYVLALIRQAAALQSQLDRSTDPEAELVFETTVADWREACDLEGPKRLGMALNQWFDTRIGSAEWLRLLRPADERTLTGVCDALASRMRRPVVVPASLGGRPCRRVGAFFAIKSMLASSGVPVERIRPSSALQPYLRRHLAIVLTEVPKLRPSVFRKVTVQAPAHRATTTAMMGGAALWAGTTVLGAHAEAQIGLLTFLFAHLLAIFVARLPPRRVRLDDLRTFGDLATAVAGPPRWPLGPQNFAGG